MDGSQVAGFRMTDAEREQLARDGYVIREKVFSREECATMQRQLDSLVGEILSVSKGEKLNVGSYMFEKQHDLNMIVKWEPGAPDVLQGLEPFAHLSTDLMAWTQDPRFLDPCKAVCGQEDISLFTEKYNTKPARDGGKYILHQDFPYWEAHNPVAAKVATAMLFLDDADRHNGTLEVAPGSHTVGKHKRREDDIYHDLEMDESAFDMGRLIPVEVPAGSVVFFGAFLVHRSLPNTSDRDRRALLFSYHPAGHPHGKDVPRKRRWWEDEELRRRNGLA